MPQGRRECGGGYKLPLPGIGHRPTSPKPLIFMIVLSEFLPDVIGVENLKGWYKLGMKYAKKKLVTHRRFWLKSYVKPYLWRTSHMQQK